VSTEQEISGVVSIETLMATEAERNASEERELALERRAEEDLSYKSKYMALGDVKLDLEKQVRELTHRLDIALESEVACAEQRQRADMAEEREKKLMKTLADIIESGEGNTAIGTLQCSPAGLAAYAKRALEDIYA
jgi:hypothetical protein